MFFFALMLLVICASSMGFFFGCLFKDVNTASAVTPVVIMPIILFGGLISNLDSMYVWLSWIQYLSPIRYGFEIMIRNEFEDRLETLPVDPIDDLGMNIGLTNCVIVLIALAVGFRFLAYFFLKALINKVE
jgi:ABC-type transport system involved in multi-copper enzyme maturation permease subunit